MIIQFYFLVKFTTRRFRNNNFSFQTKENFKLKKIQVIISPEVIFETRRVIENKFPLLKTAFYDFLLSKPIITNKATKKDIRNAYKIIQTEDASILVGALKTKIDFLLTLDKKFIKLVKDKVNFEILSPGEFLQKYRDKINQLK